MLYPLTGRNALVAPAGSGKTRAQQEYAQAQAQAGVALDAITGISFTRVAARKLASRFVGIDSQAKSLDGFRTLHSMCYRLLGLQRGQVLTEPQIKTFFTEELKLPYESNGSTADADDYTPIPRSGSLGSALLSFIEWQRNRLLDVDTAFSLYNPSHELRSYWSLDFVRSVARKYIDFKRTQGLLDFTDMLDFTRDQGLCPDSRVLLVDEFQDCTALQVSLIDAWADRHVATLVSGDDDQLLYSFMGATVSDFRNFRADTFLLDTNFRCASNIVDFSTALIGRNKDRIDKRIRAARAGGIVRRLGILPQLNPARSTFVLARTNYLLVPIAHELEQQGVPFSMRHGGFGLPQRQNHAAFSAFRAVVALRAGRALTAAQLGSLFSFVRNSAEHRYVEHGSKKKLDDIAARERSLPQPETLIQLEDLPSFGGLPDLIESIRQDSPALLSRADPDRRAYWRHCVRRYGEDVLYTTPQITLSTIHGVKGEEADDVYLLPDISARIAEGMYRARGEREAERRVFYVAATRARDNLYILSPHGSLFYDELLRTTMKAA